MPLRGSLSVTVTPLFSGYEPCTPTTSRGTERSGHGASARGARGGSLVRFQTVTVELPVGLWAACGLPPSAPAPEPCCSSGSRPDKGSFILLPVACCTGSPLFWSASASPAPPLHTEAKAWATTTTFRQRLLHAFRWMFFLT